MKYACMLFLIASCALFSQDNVWRKAADPVIGSRGNAALTYLPDSNRFLLNMGTKDDSTTYDDIAFRQSDRQWLNLFPDPSLYGVWGDTTGPVHGKGKNDYAQFGSYFKFLGITEDGSTYLRPYLGNDSRTYAFHAYAPSTGKIYYYVNHRTFTYDTRTRRYDTLSTPLHPADYQGGKEKCTWGCLNASLKWGAMCYDPVNDKILLFGGGGVNASNGNVGTWTLDPATGEWTKLSLATEPPARTFSQMVYDPANHCIVLFGGDRLDRLLADTWIYDCNANQWVQKNPAKSPSPRAGHALIYLPKSGKVALVGGYDYTPSEATASGDAQYAQLSPFQIWTYDPAADEWRLVKSFGAGDTIPWCVTEHYVHLSTMAAADTGDNILALGESESDPWRWNPLTFTLKCNPALWDASGTQTLGVAPGTVTRRINMQDDPAYFKQDSATVDTGATENTLRNITPDTWTKITPPKSPQDRVWSTRIYDPDRDQILVWGGGHSGYYGNTVPHYSIHTNRWSIGYDAEWGLDHNYESGEGPGPFTFQNRPFMYGHPYDNYDYDVNLKKMVLIKFTYTYIYDPDSMDWDTTRIPNPPDMPGYYYYNSVTQTRHGAFAWSNTTPFGSSFQFWLLSPDSLRWRKLPVNGGLALPRYYCEHGGACYDSTHDRMIFISQDSDPGKVWTYDFATNTLAKLTPGGGTGPVRVDTDWARELVYLPQYDAVFVQGDWLYDCAANEWRMLTLANGPKSGVSSGYFYDPRRGLVWDVEKPDIYVLRLSESAVGIEKKSVVNPMAFTAVSAPNPANPVCRILFNLPEAGAVSIRVYSCDGTLVKGWDLKEMAKGAHAVAWDAKKASAGVYFGQVSWKGQKRPVSLMLVK